MASNHIEGLGVALPRDISTPETPYTPVVLFTTAPHESEPCRFSIIAHPILASIAQSLDFSSTRDRVVYHPNYGVLRAKIRNRGMVLRAVPLDISLI